MQGVLNILKPPGMTSFDVIAFLRRTTGIKKIGHMGTLDPEAIGVLPLCIGKATKAIEFLMEKDKVYRAEATFGSNMDTEDWTGAVVSTKPITHDENMVEEAVNSFVGKYKQVPPMYSAIKINGKRLYELARKGDEIERPSRDVEIYSIDIKQISINKVLFDVSCSKGTYIRTLCKDIGEKLGCGGHLSFLARTVAGEFHIEDAYTLEEISQLAEDGKLEEKLTNVEMLFDEIKSIRYNDSEIKKILNGISLKVTMNNMKNGEIVKIYTDENQFIGLGEIKKKEQDLYIKRKKIFSED